MLADWNMLPEGTSAGPSRWAGKGPGPKNTEESSLCAGGESPFEWKRCWFCICIAAKGLVIIRGVLAEAAVEGEGAALLPLRKVPVPPAAFALFCVFCVVCVFCV